MSQARDLPWALPVNDPGTPWARVDLGPPLPMPVYTAHETWNPERIGALALYCSDGRWGEAFDEFCHKRLLIPRYDRWAVPGGPAQATRLPLRPQRCFASLRDGLRPALTPETSAAAAGSGNAGRPEPAPGGAGPPGTPAAAQPSRASPRDGLAAMPRLAGRNPA